VEACTFFGDELRQKIGFIYTLNCAQAFKPFSIFTHKTHGLGFPPSFPTRRNTNNRHHKINAQILITPKVKWTRDFIRILYCHLETLFARKEFNIKFLLITNLMHFFMYLFIHFISLYVSSIKCSSSGDRIVLMHHLV
jgi:hypothetical protein